MESQLNLVLKELKAKKKLVAMLAPSFVAEFNYPDIVLYLKKAGFDKVVELTFGAKIVNKEYHKLLEKSKNLLISTVCPGIAYYIINKHPEYRKNLVKIMSPMVATAMLCKKLYPKHKTVFISPCNMKKQEAAEFKEYVDYAVDYQELKSILSQLKINYEKRIKLAKNQAVHFDKFYNDYTKIYPLAGGLSKTAHVKGIVNQNQTKIIDGIADVEKFLAHPNKDVKFLDVNFCIGGCIGGPCLSQNTSLAEKKKRVLDYVKRAMHETIPKADLGILERAKNLDLRRKF